MSATNPLYEINYQNQVASIAPVNKRLTGILQWLISLTYPLQWLHDLFFVDYYSGSPAPMWVSGNTYAYGDRVRFADNSVYEVINEAGVTDTSPVNPSNDP